jgi:hypothetical protein
MEREDDMSSHILDLPDGRVAHFYLTPMHRRYRQGKYRGIYQRPTDWITQLGDGSFVWGRTRREAMAKVIKITGGKFR